MHVRLACGLLILLYLVTIANAQLPNPALDFVYPSGGQAGTTVRLQVGGRDLDETYELIFSHPGITSRPLMRAAGEFETDAQPVAGQFEVTIPLNVPPDLYDVRAVGRFGASTPRSFVVGDVPELVESGEHHAFERPAELPLDVIMNGYPDDGAVDYYRFSAAESQTLMIECLARQIDTKLVPVMTIWDTSRRQLAQSVHLFDPLVDFQVPATGTYLLGIHDHTFAGGIDRHYRLRIHTGPYLVSISPLAAQAGSTTTFTVEGRNLPDGERATEVRLDGEALERRTISLFVPPGESSFPAIVEPTSATHDAFLFRWPTHRGHSNPLILTRARHVVIAEVETNNTPETAQRISVPSDYSGRFYPRRDQDWVQFATTAGQSYQVNVISNRLGQPTDPEVFVQKITPGPNGQSQTTQVSTEDDFRSERDRFRGSLRRGLELSHRDPVVRFTADENAEYRVGMRDLNGGSLDDPRFVYRLVIEPESPDFQLLAWAQRQATDDDKKVDRHSLAVPRGGTLPILIDILRRGGFDQPVTVRAKRLPAGVTASECQVRAGQTEAVLMLTAAADASAWRGPIEIVGEAQVNEHVQSRTALEATLTGNTDNVEQRRPTARLARQMVLAVVDAYSAPVQLRVGSAETSAGAPWETCVGGNLTLPIRCDKHAERKNDITLTAIGVPEKIKAGEIKLGPDATEGQLQLTLDSAEIMPGDYSVFLRGIVNATLARNPQAITQAQARREQFNNVVRDLDQAVQVAADQLAQAQLSVAERTALIDRFPGVPQSIRQNLEATLQQVAQIDQQWSALPSASAPAFDSAASTAPDATAPSPSAVRSELPGATDSTAAGSTDTSNANNLVAATQELIQSVKLSTAGALENLKSAQARIVQIDEQLAKAKIQLDAATAKVAEAEGVHQAAVEKRKRADEFVKQLDQQLADAQKNFGPADVASYVYSPSFTLRVARSPLVGEVPAKPIELRIDETREVPVTIQRRFGFADAVQVTLRVPNASAHLLAEPRRIERNQSTTTLQVTADSEASPGEHGVEVVLTLKFNGVEVQEPLPLKVIVAQP